MTGPAARFQFEMPSTKNTAVPIASLIRSAASEIHALFGLISANPMGQAGRRRFGCRWANPAGAKVQPGDFLAVGHFALEQWQPGLQFFDSLQQACVRAILRQASLGSL